MIPSQLEKYEALLKKWNGAYNLVAPSTLPHIKTRHIEDAVSALDYIPKDTKNIADLGSGAGIPAIILAIYLPEINFHLFESVAKKTTFLKQATLELGLKNVFVNNVRIEEYKPSQALEKFDVITARAFSELVNIFTIAEKFYDETTKFVLHKGSTVYEEIEKAEQKFSFKSELIRNKISDGFILLAENVKSK